MSQAWGFRWHAVALWTVMSANVNNASDVWSILSVKRYHHDRDRSTEGSLCMYDGNRCIVTHPLHYFLFGDEPAEAIVQRGKAQMWPVNGIGLLDLM